MILTFSSGQWTGIGPATFATMGNTDLLFMSGGSIMAHPSGSAASVASIRQAWDAGAAGRALQDQATSHPELAALRSSDDRAVWLVWKRRHGATGTLATVTAARLRAMLLLGVPGRST